MADTSIFLDCGAFSFWNAASKAQRAKTASAGRDVRYSRLDSFEYTTTPKYLAYRDAYADFVVENRAILDVYPNLDVVGNPELTYANQVYLEDRGLTPSPVWHFGSDVKWLERYLAEGHPHLCIGGMPGTREATLRPTLDRLWARYLTDGRGMPLVKVHGFGMTMIRLMFRYPWHSVDSSSWKDYGRRGRLLLPRFVGKGLNYHHPWVLYVTHRRRNASPHVSELDRGTMRRVLDYLGSLGAPLGQSAFIAPRVPETLEANQQWANAEHTLVEETLVPGVRNSYHWRDEANLHYYLELEDRFPAWPWPLARSIKEGMLR